MSHAIRPVDVARDRIGDYIQVFSGGPFWPLDPRPGEIHLADLTHALVRIGRYTGHTQGDYPLSVAQHSVLVSRACDPVDVMGGLLHDASEAYTNDLSRPLKHLPELAPFRAAEVRLQDAIQARFGLPPGIPAAVKRADDAVLAAEVRDLMTPDPRVWGKWLDEITPYPEKIKPWPTWFAERAFLERFAALQPV
jgi:5'-deoxynucleotidase YfbR-like HD superfamily hydrolase